MPLPGPPGQAGRRHLPRRLLRARGHSAETRARGQLRGGGREASGSAGCAPARLGGSGGSGVSPARPSRRVDVGRSARGSAWRCEEDAWWETHPRTRIQTPEAPGLLFPTRRLCASAHLPLPLPTSHGPPPPSSFPSLLLSPTSLKKTTTWVECGGKVRLPPTLPYLRRGPSCLGGVLWIVASVYLSPAKGLGPKRRFHQSPRSRFLLQRCS